MRGWFILGAILLFFAVMAFAIFRLEGNIAGPVILGSLFLLFVVVAILVKTFKPDLPFESEIIDRSRGVVRLRFSNVEYGRLVARQAKEADVTSAANSETRSSTAIKE